MATPSDEKKSTNNDSGFNFFDSMKEILRSDFRSRKSERATKEIFQLADENKIVLSVGGGAQQGQLPHN